MSNFAVAFEDPVRELRGPVVQFLAFGAIFLLLNTLVHWAGLTGGTGAAVLFVLCAVAIFWQSTQQNRAYRLQFEQVAASLGFHAVETWELRLSTWPLRTSGRKRNVVGGKLRGLDAWLFDYSISDGDDGFTQTVAAFRVDEANLPIFDLRPMGLWTGMVDRRSADDEYFEAVSFSVPCPFELKTSAKEAVARYFTDELVSKLARIRDWHCVVQGYHTTVLCFIPGTTIQPQELDSFARKSADVAYEIFSASRHETILI